MPTFTVSMVPRPVLVCLVGVLALTAAACGTNEDGSAGGVASLEDVAAAEPDSSQAGLDGSAENDDSSAEGTDDPASAELAADEAALAFSECMRDEGLDFPDIGVDADGNPQLGTALQDAGLDPRSDDFSDALEACSDELDGVGFGGGRGAGGLADNTELQDAFFELSECMRDEGFDVGDLQFGGGGGQGGPGGGGEDGPPARGQGQGQGRFGDPNRLIAQALDLDPEDPAVAAALEVCGDIIENAFAQIQPGGARDNS